MNAKLEMILAMIIFGSVGLFASFVSVPSCLVAFFRGVSGLLCLVLFFIFTKRNIDRESIRRNRKLLILSGLAMGMNWAALYEAYHHTTVAITTLCTYLAPILIIVVSPLIFHEKITFRKILCLVIAMTGLTLISGILSGGFPSGTEAIGIVLGLVTAVCYGTILIANKLMKDIDMLLRTTIQIGISILLTGPYSILSENWSQIDFDAQSVIVIIIMGIFHTAIAYSLVFHSMSRMTAQSAAILTYVDPAVAVLISVFLLNEPIGISGILGAVLIVGAALMSEMSDLRRYSRMN